MTADWNGRVTFFTNGTIYLDADCTASSLLVQDGIVKAADVTAPAAAGVVDLRGATAYPGFCDSHNHLMEAGLGVNGTDLNGVREPAEIVAKARAAADQLPEGAPLIGIGYSLADYDAWSLADLAALDAATGSRATLFVDNLGHNTIFNTAAMALAPSPVTPETPLPPAGMVGFEEGQPTGMFRESAMTLVGVPALELFQDDVIKAGTAKLMAFWAASGYTSIVDEMGTPIARLMKPEIFREFEAEGTLPLRVFTMYNIACVDDVDGALRYVGTDTDMVRFGGCKLFVDGGFGAGQAWTSWANEQGGHGVRYVASDDEFGEQYNLVRIVDRVDELGLNLHYHVQGDQGVEAILTSLDAAVAKRGRLSSTHTLIHVGFCRPDQIRRLQGFGANVNATVQPAFWKLEGDSAQYYGPRLGDSYDIKSLIEAGICTGMSTDFSVSPLPYAPPLVFMPIALQPEKCDPPVRRALTMRDLVFGLSAGSATVAGSADTGTLHPGMKADLSVFSHDLYKVADDELPHGVKVLATFVGGRPAYTANA